MTIKAILDTDDKFKLGLALVLDREAITERQVRAIYLNWLQEHEYN
jgi:hypothetical protein